MNSRDSPALVRSRLHTVRRRNVHLHGVVFRNTDGSQEFMPPFRWAQMGDHTPCLARFFWPCVRVLGGGGGRLTSRPAPSLAQARDNARATVPACRVMRT